METHVVLARLLRRTIETARAEVETTGKVPAHLLDQADEICATLVEAMPPDAPKPRR